ncbi:MAG: hypothetical protein AAGC95_10895 [Pseudomonadota bacterium]
MISDYFNLETFWEDFLDVDPEGAATLYRLLTGGDSEAFVAFAPSAAMQVRLEQVATAAGTSESEDAAGAQGDAAPSGESAASEQEAGAAAQEVQSTNEEGEGESNTAVGSGTFFNSQIFDLSTLNLSDDFDFKVNGFDFSDEVAIALAPSAAAQSDGATAGAPSAASFQFLNQVLESKRAAEANEATQLTEEATQLIDNEPTQPIDNSAGAPNDAPQGGGTSGQQGSGGSVFEPAVIETVASDFEIPAAVQDLAPSGILNLADQLSSGGQLFVPVATNAKSGDGVQEGVITTMTLENLSSSSQTDAYKTFGLSFVQGDVPSANESLVANINGVDIPVQMDVKATYEDGSVKHAVLTVKAPQLSGNGDVQMTIGLGQVSGASNVSASDFLSTSYDFKATFDLEATTASPAQTVEIDVGALLTNAINTNQIDNEDKWLEGQYVTEFSITETVSPHIDATFNIRLYADGNIRTEVVVANENIFTNYGLGNVVYDLTLEQNGVTIENHQNVEHNKFARWHESYWASGGDDDIHVAFDYDYLASSGAVQRLDDSYTLSEAAQANLIANWSNFTNAPMETGANHLYMPGTGQTSGNFVGIHTDYQIHYLLSQDADLFDAMISSADAAASAPWHLRDSGTGEYVSVLEHPAIYVSKPNKGEQFKTDDPLLSQDQQWALDLAHQPAYNYAPYLLTGEQFYAEEIAAQTSFTLSYYSEVARNGDDGLFVYGQWRSAAWAFRNISDAVYILPDDDPLRDYFVGILDNNLDELLRVFDEKADIYGQLSGFSFPGTSVYDTRPWQLDMIVQSLGLLAERGNEKATDVLKLMDNYISGRFISEDIGFDPRYGSQYSADFKDGNGDPYTTWEDFFNGNYSNGALTEDYINGSDRQAGYAGLSKGAVATTISATGSHDAIQAYGYIVAHSEVTYDTEDQSTSKWDVAPLLADGSTLERANYVLGDAAANVYGGADGNELIHGRDGSDTLAGKGGIDLIYGGDGDDVIDGGQGDDFLFGNAGDDVLRGGDGDDVIRGNDGDDEMYGGDGDDILYFQDNDIVDGGAGTDTVALQSWRTATIDLKSGDFTGIEAFDLRNQESDAWTEFDIIELDFASAKSSTGGNSLTIYGDVNDVVLLDGAATRLSNTTINGEQFARFTDGSFDIYVQLGMTATTDSFDGVLL